MSNSVYDLAHRARSICSEWLLLLLVGLAACWLALAYPAQHRSGSAATSWREKNWVLWWNAQQMYQREPDELSEGEMRNVEDWCLCLALIDRYRNAGLRELTDEECQFVMVTLGALCPDLAQHASYFPIYESCRRRLSGAELAGPASPSQNLSVATASPSE